jgi:hypothetical protein
MTDTVEHDGIPIFGPMLEAGLYDPTDAPHDSSWLPYNNAAAELACCLEACKQVTELAAVFAVCPHPPRAYTLPATPVLSLAEHTAKIYQILAKFDRSNWPVLDLENLKYAARLLKRQIQGPLRLPRNQLSAHQDIKAMQPGSDVPPASAAVVLPALSHSLVMLILLHNHRDAFAYFRLPDPARVDEVQIFVQYPLATLFRVNASGTPVQILKVRFAADPRHESRDIVLSAMQTYNVIAQTAVPACPVIDLISHDRPTIFDDGGRFDSRILYHFLR